MKKIFLFFYFSFFFLAVHGQTMLVKKWDKRYTGNDGAYMTAMQLTPDGGFIIGGYSASSIYGDKTQASRGSLDFWIVKTDSMGTKKWDKTFGGGDWDRLFSLQLTADGGYILGGYTRSDSSGDKTAHSRGGEDYWIVKADSQGNKQWDKTFGGHNDDLLLDVKQTQDGGYILGGYSESPAGGDKSEDSLGQTDYWIIKTDSAGNKQWDKTFGGTIFNNFASLQLTSDGGYILGGSSISEATGTKSDTSRGRYDYWIIKIDSLGAMEWDKTIGGDRSDFLFHLLQTKDGGYILAGTSASGISGEKTSPAYALLYYDYWIVKTDAFGNRLWDKTFGTSQNEDDFGNVIETADGGYLFTGTSYGNIGGDKTEGHLGVEQTWSVKTDGAGNKEWDKTIFTTGHDESGFAFQTTGGCYVFASATDAGIGGYKTTPTIAGDQYWIVKFCDSTITTAVMPFEQTREITLSPNPAGNELIISTGAAAFKSLEIYNMFGQICRHLEIAESGAKIKADVSMLPPGIYFIQLTGENESRSGRFVKN